MQLTDTFEVIRETIARITSLEPDEIHPEDQIEELLQTDVEVQFPKIISALNNRLDIDLDPIGLTVQASDEENPLTIKDVLTMTQEEIEY
jgi:hypothetical protein